jgi:GTPase SAR1 family protein
LREALIEALLPGEQTGRVEAESPLVVAGSGNAFPYTRRRIEQDNGCYYFNCKHDPNNKSLISCYFTGKAETVTVQVDPEKREITRVSVRTGSFADLVSAFRDQQARISRLIEVQAKSYSGVGDRELIEFIFSLEPLIDLLEKKYAPTFDPSADVAPGIPRRDVTTREVWAALRDTEVDTLQSLEVSSGEIEESRAGFLLVPYVTDSGRPLDFTSQDRVFVTIEADEKNHSAELELSETTKDKVALKAIRRGFRSALHPGVVLRLESQASKSSRDVRTKAVNRVLDGKSVIPDITSFFDREASKGMQVRLATTPSEDLLRSQYDSAEKRLNEKQVVAFQKLAAMGPVGVLQGPPGTGKTAFISKFIHFLFHNQEVTNVLLVGQSHTSVDNVAALTRQLFIEQDLELAVVRIGQERMIATEMLDSHSKALQRQIRHGFHREFEHRVKALTPPLGLPASFVDATISAYRDLAPLLASLASAERARKFALAPVAVEDEEGLEELPQTNGDERTDVDERVAELETQLQTIARRIDSDMPLSGLCAENAWQRVMNALIVRHGISNPAASSRFSAVLSLSQEWLNILGTGEANYDQFLVKTRQLVCGTLVGMGNRQVGLSETLFDWVIVDEAARAQAGELMVAIQTGKRVLLVGDHRQLPPHYNRGHLEKAAKLLRVEKSIVEKTDFQRAFESTGGLALDTQYRMCRPICDLVSECFYREDVGLLNTGRDETPEWYSRLPTPLNASVVWIESGGNDPKGNEKDPTNTAQYVNLAEAEITLSVLRILAHEEFAARLRESITGSDKYAIGIITMYRAQKDLLELRLSKAEWAIPIRDLVKIDTVDSYQGKENKVVILSLVRDNEKGKQGFLHEDPRVNVSVSRAEERLIIIGASKMWTKWNRTFALGSVYKFIDDKVEAGNGNYRIAEGRDIVGAAHG